MVLGKKKKTALLLAVVLLIFSFVIDWAIGILMLCLGLLFISFAICSIVLNKLIKKTNWYSNKFRFTHQFVSNMGYRDNIIRNYDIVNLGSNPAAYGLFYEKVKGQNWATGSQGLDMDFEILKYFHSYIKKGGYVLIPIMPFSSISPYIKVRGGFWNEEYYAKFASILDYSQVDRLPNSRKVRLFLKYPLLVRPKAIQYLVKDVERDNSIAISEQLMMEMELMQHAQSFMKGWLHEFNLKALTIEELAPRMKYAEEAISIVKNMVDYCIERELKPVFITIPMTDYLSSLFPENVTKLLTYDFIDKCNVRNILFLDYSKVEELKDSSLFKDSFFYNLKGRKVFTNQVLKDLKLV